MTDTEVARRKTQAERRLDSERLLVRATIEIILRNGVGALTFDALSERGGLSRGMVTQRFGSKQGLIDSVLAYLHDRQEGILRDLNVDGRPGFEALQSYLDFYLRDIVTNDEGRAYFIILASEIADAATRKEFFRLAHERMKCRIQDWIERGQREGTVRKDIDVGSVSLMIGGLLLGLSMQLIVDSALDVSPIRVLLLSTIQSELKHH